jgi:hypothetical protein
MYRHSLHIVKRVEEWVNELRGQDHELRQFGLESRIDSLVFLSGHIEILLQLERVNITLTVTEHGIYLEEISLVVQGLLFLLPQLIQAVIMTVIIHQLRWVTIRICQPYGYARTLWSLFVRFFRIAFIKVWNSLAGAIIRLDMSSNSGLRVSLSSCIAVE